MFFFSQKELAPRLFFFAERERAAFFLSKTIPKFAKNFPPPAAGRRHQTRPLWAVSHGVSADTMRRLQGLLEDGHLTLSRIRTELGSWHCRWCNVLAGNGRVGAT